MFSVIVKYRMELGTVFDGQMDLYSLSVGSQVLCMSTREKIKEL
jgi:hypothetical protein